jgi:hypothetical protein
MLRRRTPRPEQRTSSRVSMGTRLRLNAASRRKAALQVERVPLAAATPAGPTAGAAHTPAVERAAVDRVAAASTGAEQHPRVVVAAGAQPPEADIADLRQLRTQTKS